MNAKEAIKNNLSLQTLETAKAYLLTTGETEESITLERAGNILANHFDILLDAHFNDSFGRGDTAFESSKDVILALTKIPENDLKAKEEFFSYIWNLFAGGYLNGYVMGVKDTETLLNEMTNTIKAKNDTGKTKEERTDE